MSAALALSRRCLWCHALPGRCNHAACPPEMFGTPVEPDEVERLIADVAMARTHLHEATKEHGGTEHLRLTQYRPNRRE